MWFVQETLPRIVEALAWPVLVFVLVFWYRRQVRDLLATLTEAKTFFGEFAFGKAKGDNLANSGSADAGRQRASLASANWGKHANVYWLGFDLMWTHSAILRNGDIRSICYGLKQTLHHLGQVGLQDTSAGRKIRTLFESLRHKSAISIDDRRSLVEELWSAGVELGRIAEGETEGYDNGRGSNEYA